MKQGTQKFLIRTDQRIQFGKYGDTRRRKDKNTSKIPPEGMTSKDIRRMSEEELPDIDYFLNKLTLMTILEKNFFTSFKSQTIYLSCPHICGRFSIQKSAAYGLSYKAKLQKTPINNRSLRKEATNGFEPMIRELQSHALPLG